MHRAPDNMDSEDEGEDTQPESQEKGTDQEQPQQENRSQEEKEGGVGAQEMGKRGEAISEDERRKQASWYEKKQWVTQLISKLAKEHRELKAHKTEARLSKIKNKEIFIMDAT